MNMHQTINITIDNKDKQGQDQKQKQEVTDGKPGNSLTNEKVKVTTSNKKSVKDVK